MFISDYPIHCMKQEQNVRGIRVTKWVIKHSFIKYINYELFCINFLPQNTWIE